MRPLLLALAATAALAPAASALTYTDCSVLGAHARSLTHRIAHVQDAIDVSATARAEKRLRVRLRALKRQRAHIFATMNAKCSPPSD